MFHKKISLTFFYILAMSAACSGNADPSTNCLEDCATPGDFLFTDPQADVATSPILLAVSAPSTTASVNYYVDGLGLVGNSKNSQSAFDFPLELSRYGTRTLEAVAFGDDNYELASTSHQFEHIADPNTEHCFMGSDRNYSTCMAGIHSLLTNGEDFQYNESCENAYGDFYAPPTSFFDLLDLSDDLNLAPNFILKELAQSSKGRYAIIQPSAVHALQTMRDEVGVLNINSGYRSPSYNQSIGGAGCSRHMYGDAFDISPAAISIEELGLLCEKNEAGYVELYETHVHCDWRDSQSAHFEKTSRSATIVRQGSRLWAPAEGWDEGEPLRTWILSDGSGQHTQITTGRSLEVPPWAVRVDVNIGGQINRTFIL